MQASPMFVKLEPWQLLPEKEVKVHPASSTTMRLLPPYGRQVYGRSVWSVKPPPTRYTPQAESEKRSTTQALVTTAVTEVQNKATRATM